MRFPPKMLLPLEGSDRTITCGAVEKASAARYLRQVGASFEVLRVHLAGSTNDATVSTYLYVVVLAAGRIGTRP